MWCILQCSQGREEQLLNTCRRHLAEPALKDAFIFTCERMKRYCGSWHKEVRPMFPGYIFLKTDCKDILDLALKGCLYSAGPHLVQGILQQVAPEEEAYLMELCGQSHHLPMSRGYISNKSMHITEGPLLGMEHRIRKVDRHKRTARIIPPNSRSGELVAGLEVISKN